MWKTYYTVDQVLTTGQIRTVRGCWVSGDTYLQVPALNPETPSYDSSNRYDYIPKEQVAETYLKAREKAIHILQARKQVLQDEQDKIDTYLREIQWVHRFELDHSNMEQ